MASPTSREDWVEHFENGRKMMIRKSEFIAKQAAEHQARMWSNRKKN